MKWLRIIIFIGLGLLSVAFLVLVFENARGKRAWFKFKTEWEAKGERFDLASFIPKPVPDSENFAMTPLFVPLFQYHNVHVDLAAIPVWHDSNALARAQNATLSGKRNGEAESFGGLDKNRFTNLKAWQGYYRSNKTFSLPAQSQSPAADILHALSKHDDIFAELHGAANRPYARFPIHYDENFSAQLKHLAVLKELAAVLRLRTLALLAENRPGEALADLRLILRCADALKTDPLVISHLVRHGILNYAVNTIWEGIATGRWNDQHLAEIQTAISAIYLFPEYYVAIRGERAFSNALIDMSRTGNFAGAPKYYVRYAPGGFFYHNQLFLNRLYQKYALDGVDVENRRLNVDRVIAGDNPSEMFTRNPYSFMAHLMYPAHTKFSVRMARTQTLLDMAALACAIERYHLVHGTYPTTLQDLKPRFMRAIPNDVITGETLRYAFFEADEFLLYSVGLNRKDDGGVPAPPNETRRTNHDWTWRSAPRSTTN